MFVSRLELTLRILYLGARSGTSLHRANALTRLGHDVEIIDPDQFLPPNQIIQRFHRETGSLYVGNAFHEKVVNAIGDKPRDVLWVDHGRVVGAREVQHARSLGMKTLVLNVDDPFGTRDRLIWLLYKKTVKEYDLTVVVREPNVEEARELGAPDVLKVWRSADEVAHRPVCDLTPEEAKEFSSEVLFLGTWMKGRGKFLKDVADQGIPITIIGDRWHRAPEWSFLKQYWRGSGVYNDRDYAAHIQCAKVCIGLLSYQNRDLHTTRSAEIPLIGSVFCAERSAEHCELYEGGLEAEFWSDATECATKCKALLADNTRRIAIAKAGQARCIANGTLNEPVMESVLAHLFRNR